MTETDVLNLGDIWIDVVGPNPISRRNIWPVSSGQPWEYSLSGGSDGHYTATVKARDKAGNVAATPAMTFTLDSAPPSLSLALSAAPPTGYISGTTAYYGQASGLFTVTATAGDPLAGLDTLAFPDTTSSGAEHTLNGAVTATRSRVYTFDQSSIFSATAGVTAADRAGNVQTVPFTVTRDITPPEVAIDVPANSGLVIPVTWSGQDTLSGVRDYTIRYSHSLTGPWTVWLTGTTATSGQFPGAADQTYYFQVEAVDNVNNTATAQAGPVTIHSVTKYYYHSDTRVAMRQGDVVYYLHSDHLGSTSLTTNQAGGVVAHTRYLPYGEQRWTDGDTPTDFTFTGQRTDGFGLLDYNARYYDSYLNRFVSPDSIVPDYANPQSLNRYSYTVNNPLKFIDRDGHCHGLTGTAFNVCIQAALAVAPVVHKANEYRQDVFFPDANTTIWERGEAAAAIATGGVVGGAITYAGLHASAFAIGGEVLATKTIGKLANISLTALTGSLASSTGNAIGQAINQAVTGQSINIDTGEVVVAGSVGYAAGGLAAMGGATRLRGAMALGGIQANAQYALTQLNKGGDITPGGMLYNSTIGLMGGAMSGSIPKGNSSFASFTGSSAIDRRVISDYTVSQMAKTVAPSSLSRGVISGVGTTLDWELVKEKTMR